MTNLQRRLRKLEARNAPHGGRPRLVVRYEGCGWGDPDDEPVEDFDENDPNTVLLIVQYVDMPPKSPLGPARRQPDLPLE
jgi:hypothetical protein